MTNVAPGVSGIVLAGGRSSRFGSDKLAAEVDDQPLLHLAIAALAAVCDEVVVVVGAGGPPSLPRGLVAPVRVVRDAEPGAGPLAGLNAGLESARGPVVIVAGGDMPRLVPAVLRELAVRASGPDVDAAVLFAGGSSQPLPSAFRRDVALQRTLAVRARGGSSLKDLLRVLRVARIREADWRAMDPGGSTLIDVDRPADLVGLSGPARRPRG